MVIGTLKKDPYRPINGLLCLHSVMRVIGDDV